MRHIDEPYALRQSMISRKLARTAGAGDPVFRRLGPNLPRFSVTPGRKDRSGGAIPLAVEEAGQSFTEGWTSISQFEQCETLAKLLVIGRAEYLMGRQIGMVEDSFGACEKTQAKDRMSQVCHCFSSRLDSVAVSHDAPAEDVDLGEYEPHPVRLLVAALEFVKRGSVNRSLCGDKSAKVENDPVIRRRNRVIHGSLPNKSFRSALRRSGTVAKRPCGSPSYSINFAPTIPLAAGRPAVSIGMILSEVPRITSVGIVKAARSLRKSVLPNAFGLAMTDRMNVQSSRASLTGLLTRPTP
jgi:hypothetical protein